MLLGVDVGGTFTDAVLAVDGRLVTAKAPTHAERSVRGRDRGRAGSARARRPPGGRGARVRARDDRRDERAARGRGARTALIATDGFTDVVELGRQDRAAPLPAVRRRARPRSSPPSCASARRSG